MLSACCVLFLTGCSKAAHRFSDWEPTGSMVLSYAEQFSVDYYADGYARIRIGDGSEYLLVPEGGEIPEDTGDCTVLCQPLTSIYAAASSAVDLFDGIGALDTVTMTSTSPANWSLPAVRDALESGRMQYVGSYSAPDYEQILSGGCSLALESTMIYHSPETKEQLEQLGIPVLVERSSYESHPLGRLEWIRLYGLLVGKEAEAEALFAEKSAMLETVTSQTLPEKQTVAFFSVSPNGYVTVHKPGDYVCRMIELAGGQYCFTAESLHVEENALSTMNIQMEQFCETAKDCDVLIYNSAIDNVLTSMAELREKDAVLGEFRAVQEGNVWCTDKNMFQQTTGAAEMIAELHRILDGTAEDDMTFLHRLQ